MAKQQQRLGDLLVEHKVITKKQLKQAQEELARDREGRRLGRILVDLNFVGEETLISFLARQCGMPHLRLGDYEIDSEVIKYVSPELVIKYQAVPIDKLGKILTVAMVDPLDDEALEGLQKATGFVVKPIVCSEKDIEDAIERYYGAGVLEASKEYRRRLASEAAGEVVTEQEPVAVEESLEGLRPLKAYTFDEFVVGHANQFTYATAKAVAEAPAQDYNPLFIYSGVGLGKTHLINAIGNHILARDPNSRVIYLSSERFTAELVSAIQRNDIKSFRRRYREVDVLLLDDIHFLAGKERAQEEFFHTFNELYNAHKQIVTTSDRPPKSMLTLEKRLRSRFEGGIITDIQPPEYETRLAILHKKLERMGQRVDDSVLELLAERITSNIRELEGALRGVIASAEAAGESITRRFAERVLDDILGESEAALRQRELEEEVDDLITKAKARLQDVIEAGVEAELPEAVEQARSQLEAAVEARRAGDLNSARREATESRERSVALLREVEESRKVRARERLEAGVREKLAALQEMLKKASAVGVDAALVQELADGARAIEGNVARGADPVPLEAEVSKLSRRAVKAIEEASVASRATEEARALEWEITAVQADLDRLAAMTKGRLGSQAGEAERLLREAGVLARAGQVAQARDLVKQARAIAVALRETEGEEAEEPQKLDASQAVKSAVSAIERAKAEGARELSPEPLEEAEDLVINAEAMLDAEEFDEALAYALRAEEAALRALSSAIEQKTEMKRKETEENLAKALQLVAQAREIGADEYAPEELDAVLATERQVRAASAEQRVPEAHAMSLELVAACQKLVEETKNRKTEALRKRLEDLLTSAEGVVEQARARGAAKYCGKELAEIERRIGDGKRFLKLGQLEKGIESSLDLPDVAHELARKTEEARAAEEALRKRSKETLREAESILQGALAAGALRYVLKTFQEAQVALARAVEMVDGDDPQRAFQESQAVLEQARRVLEAIEQKKLEAKRAELQGVIQAAKASLEQAVREGAEKYVPSLLAETRNSLASIEAALAEGRYDDGLALRGQLEELVRQTRQEAQERREHEERIRNHCKELLGSVAEFVAQSEALDAARYAGHQLALVKAKVGEVNELLAADKVEDAETAAEAALSMAENLLLATREERAAEMRRTLEGYVETLSEMLRLILETGGRRYAPEKVQRSEARLEELHQYLSSGQYESGLEYAAPLEAALSQLQQETEAKRAEEEELRRATRSNLDRAEELLGQSIAIGAAEFAEDSLKNVQALFTRAVEVSRSDDTRRAFELSQGVMERAAKLVDETKVRKAEALRARLSRKVAELHRGLAEAKAKEVDRYAPEMFKQAQERIRSVEASLRSEDFETGLSVAEQARVTLEEATEQARLRKEEEARVRKEVEERLSQAAKTALEAENEGARTFAADRLRAYRMVVQETKDLLVKGEVEKAFVTSQNLVADAQSLLQETLIAKRRAMQQQIADGLAAATRLVEEAEEAGAIRFVPEKLQAWREMREGVVSLMERGDLVTGVERVEALRTEAEQLKAEALRRKKEEEDFKNRVEAALKRAEQVIADAEKAGVVGKELKKAEVLLGQAKRAQEAANLEKSLKFSALATSKAMELMAEAGIATPPIEDLDLDLSVSEAPVTKEEARPATPVVSEEALPSLRPKPRPSPLRPTVPPPAQPRVPADPKLRAELERQFQLIKDMTFETFQVGDVNRFTYQTARAVAESPGTAMYNPLFVHGSVGVGKTHLINATGWKVKELMPDALVVYMSSEGFANVLVEAIETDSIEALRARFAAIDVLIVDDIQFLAGRERAQEEFALVFNRMVNQNKQVIISSDRPPSELTTLSEMLRSRFEKGFVTDLQLPEAAVRTKILRRQAEREGLDIPEKVIKLLAESINTNLRELQGALKKLVAHCRLSGRPVDLSAAVEVLKSIMPDIQIDMEALGLERALTEEELALLEEERRLREEEERLKAEEARLAAEELRLREEEKRLREEW